MVTLFLSLFFCKPLYFSETLHLSLLLGFYLTGLLRKATIAFTGSKQENLDASKILQVKRSS